MPELPEVETTRRGLLPHVVGRQIRHIIVRNARLRWTVSNELIGAVRGQPVLSLERRAKYLLLGLPEGSVILHLGMSGSLRVIHAQEPAGVHDHVDFVLDNATAIRLRDPRRFGAVLWHPDPPDTHPLLAGLGPEPLDGDLAGTLWQISRSRAAIKTVLMDSRRIVGIGNIYANESLHHAGISPWRQASLLDRHDCEKLAASIRTILENAIAAGGSSLRDFVGADSKPGYFQQTYAVYGRTGLDCPVCHTPVSQQRMQQRSTFWCTKCQK